MKQNGVVEGVNSAAVMIGGRRFWSGECSTRGIEINDTVEYEVGPGDTLTHLLLLKEEPVAAQKSAPDQQKPAATPAPAAAAPPKSDKKKQGADGKFDSKRCLDGTCPDGKKHYWMNETKKRMECDCVGQPLNLMPGNVCPLDPKEEKAKDPAPAAAGSPAPAKETHHEVAPAAANQSPGGAAVQTSHQPAARVQPQPGATPVFHKAVRKSAKLRVGLCGTAGAGKTWDALQIAFGIGGPIAVIDTENASAELYAHLGEYDVCVLSAPFTAQKYTDAIHAAERAGYNVIILDSITHAWSGEGGLLDIKDNIAKSSKSGNSFTAWKDVTPLHRGFVEAMLQSPCHIIATMRSKTEYVIDTDDRGWSFPRKIGMAPIQREGMDYEFTLVFDIEASHIATASKDRTSLFTGKSFMPSAETGRLLKEWLDAETTPGSA